MLIDRVRFERQDWTELDYEAVASYWKDHSSIYRFCELYSSLIGKLKQGYWNYFASDSTAKEGDTPRPFLNSLRIVEYNDTQSTGKLRSNLMK